MSRFLKRLREYWHEDYGAGCANDKSAGWMSVLSVGCGVAFGVMLWPVGLLITGMFAMPLVAMMVCAWVDRDG